MFKRILIANRGEIAVRIIRACRELGIESIAVYSDADRAALHVREADHAYPVGPAPAAESYLNTAKILEAAKQLKADAVHPGYGFFSERAAFARAVQKAGLTWIGPPPEAIEQMGDKVEARKLMSKAGVPVVPGSPGTLETEAEVAAIAKKIGFPIMVKAAAGGGGKGLRFVENAKDLASIVRTVASEAKSSFGDGRFYVEKFLKQPRHIEVQVLADAHGNTVHVFERECSIQRRHQKVVEESPSPFITPKMRAEMGEVAVRAAKAVNYVSAGTIEFLVDADRNFYFLEMNTRIQVEHPVTELVTGIDLVRAQIEIAAGAKLPFKQKDLAQRGWAIECRIYAEDPTRRLRTGAGKDRDAEISRRSGRAQRRGCLRGRGSAGVLRPDDLEAGGVGRGSRSGNRPDAARTRRIRDFGRAAHESGLPSLDHDASEVSERRVRYEFYQPGVSSERKRRGAAGRRAGRDFSGRNRGAEEHQSQQRGRRAADRRAERVRMADARPARHAAEIVAGPLSMRYLAILDGNEHEIEIEELAADSFSITFGKNSFQADLRKVGPVSFSVIVDNRSFDFDVARDGEETVVASRSGSTRLTVADAARRTARAAGKRREVSGRVEIKSAMPGRVVNVLVAAGDEVKAEQGIIVVEAMKMENEVKSPKAGKVVEVKVVAGQAVEKGQLMIVIE